MPTGSKPENSSNGDILISFFKDHNQNHFSSKIFVSSTIKSDLFIV